MNPKSVFASKTIWANGLAAIIAALTGLMNAEWIAANPGWTSALVSVLGVLNIGLRWITTQPVAVNPTEASKAAARDSRRH